MLTSRRYSFAHSQFVWDAKSEPKIIELFETIWGTPELTVSFGKSYSSLMTGTKELTAQTEEALPFRCRPSRSRATVPPGLT